MEVACEAVAEADSRSRAEAEEEAVRHAAASAQTGNSKEIARVQRTPMESKSTSRIKHNEFGHCNDISHFRFCWCKWSKLEIKYVHVTSHSKECAVCLFIENLENH